MASEQDRLLEAFRRAFGDVDFGLRYDISTRSYVISCRGFRYSLNEDDVASCRGHGELRRLAEVVARNLILLSRQSRVQDYRNPQVAKHSKPAAVPEQRPKPRIVMPKATA